MFFEFVTRLLSFDLAWLATLVMSNFHYLFAFGALLFIFFDNKLRKAIPAFFIFCILAWAFIDLQSTSGWLFFAGGFLLLNYIVKISTLVFAQSDPRLSKHLLVVNFFAFYALWVAYNMFMVR